MAICPTAVSCPCSDRAGERGRWGMGVASPIQNQGANNSAGQACVCAMGRRKAPSCVGLRRKEGLFFSAAVV